jgi:hypothetical protein
LGEQRVAAVLWACNLSPHAVLVSRMKGEEAGDVHHGVGRLCNDDGGLVNDVNPVNDVLERRFGCNAGATSLSGSRCVAGKYTPPLENTDCYSGAVVGAPCLTCPNGKSSEAGASQCGSCAPGRYGVGGACADCPPGTYGSSEGAVSATCSGVCVAPVGYGCPAGSTSSTGVVCPEGTYNDVADTQLACSVCPGGRYGDTTGLSSSTCSGACAAAAGRQCTAGSTERTGTKCAAGTYSVDGTVACAPCSPGLFSAAGASGCTTGLDDVQTDALIALYNSTGGDAWLNRTGWFVGDPCVPDPRGWAGVECSTTAPYFVLSLSLSNNNLMGTLPSVLRYLWHMTKLDMSRNQLTGSVPSEDFSSLQLLGYVHGCSA